MIPYNDTIPDKIVDGSGFKISRIMRSTGSFAIDVQVILPVVGFNKATIEKFNTSAQWIQQGFVKCLMFHLVECRMRVKLARGTWIFEYG